MGAPKQRWTAEEESALKAGVKKHGAGKWRTILKDPEFSDILSLRSNVDLKDKWRNLSVTANGLGSREKARLSLRRSRQIFKDNDSPKAIVTEDEDTDDEMVYAPFDITSENHHTTVERRSFSRLEDLILEAITKLKEPIGSNKTTIAMYIEDQYWLPPDFAELLSAKLKALTSSGRLIEVKRRYRIAPTLTFSKSKTSEFLLPETRQKEPCRIPKDDFRFLSRSQVDAELLQMQKMTAQEAATAAALAVAEAESALAEAEAASREADAAEADAEAACSFAEAAMLTMKNKKTNKMMDVEMEQCIPN